ncbi:MAG: hypothetical protein KGL63_09755 [Betaproteobacteria bacterium]|uniref:hypothetical protein n=1 Tax=Acidiphilium multivorum TaxID=62140 RepID=UPI001F4C509A|nr:hypothetical protein [Acidiphilium multivorum]MDE2343654.1 hypothetical protein [Betaproteobacteria bacterium]UNC16188.1 hypothetical protein FE249_18200 [Acidiphilium multivorum]
MLADPEFAADLEVATARTSSALGGDSLCGRMIALAASHHALALRDDARLSEALALTPEIAASFSWISDRAVDLHQGAAAVKSLAASLFGVEPAGEQPRAVEFLPTDDGVTIVEQGASPC